ncbi:MAG: hypothetical protein HC767_13945 [Akkermansiaceae bacterium]|nr:hypothetical protein [Akkermansiaceae bacterium]
MVQGLHGAEPLMAVVFAAEQVTDKITMFAPNDAAFTKISSTLTTLTPEQILEVQPLLTSYSTGLPPCLALLLT